MRQRKEAVRLCLTGWSLAANLSRPVASEEKLDEVLAWMLRIKTFRQYAEKTIINNVYMDLDMLCKNPQFKRTRSVMDREGFMREYSGIKSGYSRIMAGALSGNGAVHLHAPGGEAEKYRLTHNGQETYAFIMSNKYILGLFTYCEAARKSVVSDGVGYGHLTEQEQKFVLLDGVGDVLFQALLFDDVEYGNGGLSANLYTIYC